MAEFYWEYKLSYYILLINNNDWFLNSCKFQVIIIQKFILNVNEQQVSTVLENYLLQE